jgi:hypothetical protein
MRKYTFQCVLNTNGLDSHLGEAAILKTRCSAFEICTGCRIRFRPDRRRRTVGPVAAADSIRAGTRPIGVMASAIQPNPLLSIDQNRNTVVDRVVSNWGDALAARTLDRQGAVASVTRWSSFGSFAGGEPGRLAGGLRNVIANTLTTTPPMRTGWTQTKALGDTADDLVYTPVVPCRIVDSRNAGGAFAPGETRNYHAYLTSGTFATQGGAASNCGIPANPGAVALNLTIVSGGAGNGFFTAWPYNASRPLASTLNFYAQGQQVGNGALVPLCQPSCTADFSVFVSGSVDLIIDIVGYFKAPAALPRYVDNGDGTVTDNKTGLMWEKKLAVSDPVCTNEDQDSRDVRCQQNLYHWSNAAPFTEPTGHALQRFPGKAERPENTR